MTKKMMFRTVEADMEDMMEALMGFSLILLEVKQKPRLVECFPDNPAEILFKVLAVAVEKNKRAREAQEKAEQSETPTPTPQQQTDAERTMAELLEKVRLSGKPN